MGFELDALAGSSCTNLLFVFLTNNCFINVISIDKFYEILAFLFYCAFFLTTGCAQIALIGLLSHIEHSGYRLETRSRTWTNWTGLYHCEPLYTLN